MTKSNFTEVVPGWYRTRNGETAEVVQILDARFKEISPAWGFVGTYHRIWTLGGRYYILADNESPIDLIEYLGTEKPREMTDTPRCDALIDCVGGVDGDARLMNLCIIFELAQTLERELAAMTKRAEG